MYRKLFPLLVIGFSGFTALLCDQAMPTAGKANAQTPLTRATIQELRNLVQLMPNKQPKRKARRADAMTPGDGLSTGRSSLADLRFNDGSLARVGEQAIFRFLPQTRNFTLNNGTVLLLIPPGQGRTRIQTPSAAAAIRGSALFVRYDRPTDTTIVGALTNSGIEVLEKNASSGRVLKAGQMMVVVKGKFEGLYNFDLRTFYDTSEMVRGLELNRPVSAGSTTLDPAINSVRAETVEAMLKQSPISGAGTIQNPGFLQLTSNTSRNTNTNVRPGYSVESLQDNSVLQSSQLQENNNSNTASGDLTSVVNVGNSGGGSIGTGGGNPGNSGGGSIGTGGGNPGNSGGGSIGTGGGNPGNSGGGSIGTGGGNPGNSGGGSIGTDGGNPGNSGGGSIGTGGGNPGNSGGGSIGTGGGNPGNSGGGSIGTGGGNPGNSGGGSIGTGGGNPGNSGGGSIGTGGGNPGNSGGGSIGTDGGNPGNSGGNGNPGDTGSPGGQVDPSTLPST
ncbi:FecR family protein [Calothrix sp. PCC 6303]|uniref:FecR family protein n=1 Tax=Calothrix sp. PCC 6303 TaxID=1170562 RepID=UPI0002A029B3|nr:FecR family protein [Calothrix sp. PCC 6303]AFZ03128.1 hypothetical protein Cal6303_4217 [Calothrix sp. PCC 6303]